MHGGDALTIERSDVHRPTSIHRILPFVAAMSISAAALPDARAHSIPGTQTLHDLCRAADVVAVGRITYVAKDAPNERALPPVDADVLELLREGDAKSGAIRFLPHRHGNDQYVVGEELLLFLEHTRTPERAQEAKYEAVEAISERIVLPADRRTEWIDAARTYAALGKGPRNATDPQKLGRITIAMLSSRDTKLAHMALRDLTLAGASPLISESDVPALLRVVDDRSRPAMLRVGLLSELERRKLTRVGSHWVSVLESAPPNERSAVIAGAKSRWFVPEVNAALVAIVDGTAPDEATSAARAVGAEGNDVAVDALVRAVSREPAELRFAALGSLRRINTPRARDKLAEFAQSHADTETRKVAATELALLPPVPVVAKNHGGTNSTQSRSNRVIWLVLGALVLGAVAVFLKKLWTKNPN